MKRSLLALGLMLATLALPACSTKITHLSCSKATEAVDCLPGQTCLGEVCVVCAARETNCGDGVDEDCDGLTDCDDPDCAGQVCRALAGACDVAEVCEAGACPIDRLEPQGIVCGQPTACAPNPPRCTGDSAQCPATALEPQGTPCRPAQDCAREAVCDGVSTVCPEGEPLPATTQCFAPGPDEPCSAPAYCDGLTGPCPRKLLVGTRCGESSACELERDCTGKSVDCLRGSPKAADVVCRPAPAAPTCDLAENCNGVDLECPPDVRAAAGTACNTPDPSQGCVTALCDGVSADCPAPQLQNGFVCRKAGSKCEDDSVCDGISPACLPNLPKPVGTVCAGSGECETGGLCDDSGHCKGTKPKPAGDLCQPSVDPCQDSGQCDGTKPTCVPGKQHPDGEVCAPATQPCQTSGTCKAGVCGPTGVKGVGARCGFVESCSGVDGMCLTPASRPEVLHGSDSGGWTWVNPWPQGNTLRAVWASPNGEAWFAGERALFELSDTNSFLQFPNSPEQIVALAGETLTDGTPGKIWVVISSGQVVSWTGKMWSVVTATNPVSLVRGIGASGGKAWVVGDSIAVWDLTWKVELGPAPGQQFNAIWTTAAGDHVAVGKAGTLGVALRRDASSGLWDVISTSADDEYTSIWRDEAGDYWIGVKHDDMTATSAVIHLDAANKTTRFDTEFPVVAVAGSGGTVFAASQAGALTIFTGSGAHRQEMTFKAGQDVVAMCQGSPDEVWAVGANGFMARWDGQSWTESPTATYARLNGVAVGGADFVAVGDGGVVLGRDAQGGLGLRLSPVTTNLLAVDGPSLDDLMAVSGGVVVPLPPGDEPGTVTDDLQALRYTGSAILAVGKDAHVLTRSAATWTEALSPSLASPGKAVAGPDPDGYFLIAGLRGLTVGMKLDGSQADWKSLGVKLDMLGAWGFVGSDAIFRWEMVGQGVYDFDAKTNGWVPVDPTTMGLRAVWGGPAVTSRAGGFIPVGQLGSPYDTGAANTLNAIRGATDAAMVLNIYAVGDGGAVLHHH